MYICYSNGKSGFSFRVWGFSLGARFGVSDRHVRIGESIGRYRTLESSMPLSSAFDGDGICTLFPLVTAMLHPHSFTRTGG